MIKELESRFTTQNQMCVQACDVTPGIMSSHYYYAGKPWKEPFLKFVDFFSQDMPCITSINAELDIWRTFWLDHFDGKPPEAIRDTLKPIEPQTFPNIHACLKILGTIPATSCECERSISKMGLVLTDKRGTMGQERFNSLVLLNAHKDICLSADEVIDEFAKKRSRRIEL